MPPGLCRQAFTIPVTTLFNKVSEALNDEQKHLFIRDLIRVQAGGRTSEVALRYEPEKVVQVCGKRGTAGE